MIFDTMDLIGDDNTKKCYRIERNIERLFSVCERLQNGMIKLEKELLYASDSAWSHDITREILESREKEYVMAKTEYLRSISEYNTLKSELKELEDDLRSRGYTWNSVKGVPGVFMMPPTDVCSFEDKKWWEFWK